MKKYLATEVAFAVAAGVTLALSYAIYVLFIFQDPLAVGSPPKQNLDGTVDYTLTNKWPADNEAYYWVIRLPEDQFVFDGVNWDKFVSHRTLQGLGSTGRPNNYLNLFFKNADFEQYLRKAEAATIAPNALPNFSLNSAENPSFREKVVETENRLLLTTCKNKGLIAPGVTKYVHTFLPSGGELERGCLDYAKTNADESFYAVRDGEGILVGILICPKPSNGEEICSGIISVLNFREVRVTLASAFIPELQKIQQKLEDYLRVRSIRLDQSETLSKMNRNKKL